MPQYVYTIQLINPLLKTSGRSTQIGEQLLAQQYLYKLTTTSQQSAVPKVLPQHCWSVSAQIAAVKSSFVVLRQINDTEQDSLHFICPFLLYLSCKVVINILL